MAFNNLRKFAITADQTARFEFPAPILLGGDAQPVLIVRHAGDENPEFKSARVRAQAEIKSIGSGQSDAAHTARLRANARMFARGGIVVGWEHVYDDEAPGVLAPCTPAKVEELLLMLLDLLPDVYFALWGFAYDVSNFRVTPAVDVAALGKP